LDRSSWRGKLVLDLGCGQGVLLNHLTLGGARAIGADLSGASLRNARAGANELGLASAFVQTDAEWLPFTADSFDAVVSFGVLHHTPDTAGAVREVHRILKPGGRALVMLYRTGNPKWLATRALRVLAPVIERTVLRTPIADRLRQDGRAHDERGTALLELFGCPVLKAFSNDETRALFSDFSSVSISNHQPGFARLADVAAILRRVRPVLRRLDIMTRSRWGFYQVIDALK
jgi:SAM-dependent methyltransferase